MPTTILRLVWRQVCKVWSICSARCQLVAADRLAAGVLRFAVVVSWSQLLGVLLRVRPTLLLGRHPTTQRGRHRRLWRLLWAPHRRSSMFADSIESVRVGYSWRTSLRTAANAIGPAVSVAVFLTLGDDWSESELVLVILIGVGGFVLPALMLLLFRDSATLGTESEALTSVVAPLPPAPLPPVATAGSTLTLLGSDVPAASTPCAPPPLTEAQQLATALGRAGRAASLASGALRRSSRCRIS